jgi:hypothetical protein
MQSRRMQKHGISLATSGFCQLLAAILLRPALAQSAVTDNIDAQDGADGEGISNSGILMLLNTPFQTTSPPTFRDIATCANEFTTTVD